MKKCAKCSAAINDDDVFCPKCGAPAANAEAISRPEAIKPKKQKKEKRAKVKANKAIKVICIISAVIFALSAIAFTAISLILNTPKYRFIRAQLALLKGSGEEGAFSLGTLLKGGYDMGSHVSTDAVLKADIPGIGANVAIKRSSMDLVLNRDGYETSFNASVRLGSIPIVSGEGFMDENTVGLYFEKLSANYYTADKSLLNEALIGEKTAGLTYQKTDDIAKAYSSIVKRYGKILFYSISNSDVTVSAEDFSYTGLGGGQGECTVLTLRPSKQRLWLFVNRISEMLRTDEELSNYILSLLDHYYRRDVIGVFAGEMQKRGMSLDNGLMPLLVSASNYLSQNASLIAGMLDKANFRVSIIVSGGQPIAEYILFDDSAIRYEKSLSGTYFCINDPSESLPEAVLKLTKTRGIYNGVVNAKLMIGQDTVNVSVDIRRCDTSRKSALGVPYGEYKLFFARSGPDAPMNFNAELTVAQAKGGGSSHDLVINNADQLFNNSELSAITVSLVTSDKESRAVLTEMQHTEIRNIDELAEAARDIAGAAELIIKGLNWLF